MRPLILAFALLPLATWAQVSALPEASHVEWGPSSWAEAQSSAQPEVSSLEIEPRSVDVSNADRTVTIKIGASHPSGVSSVRFVLYRPEETTPYSRVSGTLVSGTETEGVWEQEILLPRYGLAGTWTVGAEVRTPDSFKAFPPDTLRAAGLDPGFTVVADQSDTTPPQLVSFDVSPTTLDVTSGPGTVAISARVTDDLSGLSGDSIRVSLGRPGFSLAFADLQRTSGDALDGTYTGAITLPTAAPPGTWSIKLNPPFEGLSDQTGNSASYREADLSAAGFDSTVEVTLQERGPEPTTYASREEFEAAVPDLPTETFEAAQIGETNFTACGIAIDAVSATPCFEAQELLPGLRFTSGNESYPSINATAPHEGRPWTSKVVFVNNIFEATLLEFPGGGVTAVGVDVYNFLQRDGTARATAYGTDGQFLGEFDFAVGATTPGFFGATSDEPIGRVYIDASTYLGMYEVIDNVTFGRPVQNVITEGPADGAEDVPLSPTFNWDDFAEAAAYRFQVVEGTFSNARQSGTGSQFAPGDIVLDVTVEDSQYTVPEGTLQQGTSYAWRLAPVSPEGTVGAFTTASQFTTAGSVATEQGPTVGLTVVVSPNPVRTQATVEIGAMGDVRVAVYDVLGREVVVLADGLYSPGPHRLTFDVRPLPAGAYMVHVSGLSGSASARFTVSR